MEHIFYWNSEIFIKRAKLKKNEYTFDIFYWYCNNIKRNVHIRFYEK